MRNICLLLFAALFLSHQADAQKIDSLLTKKELDIRQEKIHFHFDKNIYKKGETIWFKSYLLFGKSLSIFSKNLFVDWYDTKGKLLQHTVYPIFEASAKGSFNLPSNYTGKYIHVKAYTKRMLEVDSAFLYQKDIAIDQLLPANKQVEKHSTNLTLKLCPEGGDLYSGITSNVAFMATDERGEPIKIKGAIFNNKNEFVDSIISVHDGMGKFEITPAENDVYKILWESNLGIKQTTQIPKAKVEGATVTALPSNGKILYEVKRTEVAGDNLKEMHIVGTINHSEIYEAKVNLLKRKTMASSIPIEGLPTGILTITLFDANWIPMAERIVFVNNHQHEFYPDIKLITTNLNKRARNIIEVNVNDTILSNMSIAIADESVSNNQKFSIFSDLLLSGELRGTIYNAAYYFSNESDSIKNNLDLVMLTHGWRKINWEDILKDKKSTLAYFGDTSYLAIKGKAFAGGQTKFKPDQTILLMLQPGDSVKNKQSLVLPVKEDGSFQYIGAIFYDTLKVFYQLNSADKRIRDINTVSWQSTLPLVQVQPTYSYLSNEHPESYIWRDSDYYKSKSFYEQEYERLKKLYASATLKEVTVETKVKSPTEKLNDKYTSGLFANNSNGYAFDIMNDDRAQNSIDIFHYIQGLVPGLTVSIPMLGANGFGDANSDNAPDLRFRDGKPDIFLDEMPSDAATIQHIPMSQIAYMKVFKPPFMGSSGAGASGAIVIYTKRGEDIKSRMASHLMNTTILQGYTGYKEFVAPDYSILQGGLPDVRTTLYWNPYVLTDKNTKSVKIEYFNNDVTKKYRIILEGVNAFGQMTRIEKVVE